MTAYYNEFDPKAAAWLRELIKQGHIAPGDVDERSIVDIRPADLIGYTQCHFFAGIGVWSYALRQAGWPDDRPVWTGSCPCQPFSAAGKGAGFTDERHLWPHFHWLIENCQPPVVFGEQVASQDGLGWLDLVQADLEGSGYTSGAVDTCAAGFGAPHIRQRLYWVAYSDDTGSQGRSGMPERAVECAVGSGGLVGGLADNNNNDRCGSPTGSRLQDVECHTEPCRSTGGLADADGWDTSAERQQRGWQQRQQPKDSRLLHGRSTSPTNRFWSDSDWLYCRDGKWRPVEPDTFPLAHGAAERVGRLRGYGNAIVAPAAQAFIEAYLDVEHVAANDNLTQPDASLLAS